MNGRQLPNVQGPGALHALTLQPVHAKAGTILDSSLRAHLYWPVTTGKTTKLNTDFDGNGSSGDALCWWTFVTAGYSP